MITVGICAYECNPKRSVDDNDSNLYIDIDVSFSLIDLYDSCVANEIDPSKVEIKTGDFETTSLADLLDAGNRRWTINRSEVIAEITE